MAGAQVTSERSGAVALLRLDRPPANAIDLEFATELGAVFASLVSDAEVRAIVVTGTGKFFSAGLDLKRVPSYGRDQQKAMVATINRTIAQMYACRKPVVGAINGHAIAGGLIVALACDYRVGTTTHCQLGVTEARAGIAFPALAMAVLQAELEPRAARVLTLRARNVDPEAAFTLGVVDELQPPYRVLPAAIEVANDFAGIPADAYAQVKHQLRGPTISFMEETLAKGSDPLLESWLTSETADAAASLLREKH